MENRKPLRIPKFDYASPGAYFVTICTKDKEHLFGKIVKSDVGAALCGRPMPMLEKWLKELENKYPTVTVGKYVIMPNHIHVILMLAENAGGHAGPPLQTVVGWYKTMTANAYIRGVKCGDYSPFHKHLWQRSFYDHVIRTETEYLQIWQYIDENPAHWAADEYYVR